MGLSLQAQTSSNGGVKKKEKTPPEIIYPMLNGVEIGVDLWGVGSHLLGGNELSLEAQGSVNLWNKFLPTLSVGYSSSDFTDDDDFHYKHSGPFFRIGADYNALWKKKHGHMLLLGLRYGMSSATYDIGYDGLSDPIWKEPDATESGVPYWSYDGMKATMGWAEAIVGIRARITDHIFLGWNLAIRRKLFSTVGDNGQPYFVPGFGQYKTTRLGVTYHFIYKF